MLKPLHLLKDYRLAVLSLVAIGFSAAFSMSKVPEWCVSQDEVLILRLTFCEHHCGVGHHYPCRIL